MGDDGVGCDGGRGGERDDDQVRDGDGQRHLDADAERDVYADACREC